ncbi:MAG: hypothetical protein EON89_12445 [Brevundimonas sp.]|nr:MAG: hypothetical protein EON89_12445 [Brevundimonas sp.]
MTRHDPTQPQDALGRANPRMAPDEVWDRVREDYTTGIPGSECCRRHGVGLSALRARAAHEGWRRIDLPWTPPNALDPCDEGVILEEEVGGDLDKIELRQLSFVANRRMMRAVMRGHAVDAMRWSRVQKMLDREEQEEDRIAEQEEFLRYYLHGGADGNAEGEPGGRPDSTDSMDGVSSDQSVRP